MQPPIELPILTVCRRLPTVWHAIGTTPRKEAHSPSISHALPHRHRDYQLYNITSFMARLINSSEFSGLLQEDKLLVVDFFATWCGPCKKLSPTLDEVSEELGEQVNIVKVDVDESEDLAMNYGIRSVPTVLFFKNGQQVDKFVGALPKSEIVAKIQAQL